MPWYVELTEPVGGGTVKASVVEFASNAAYTKATNVQNPVPYPTKAAAQAAAGKYNGQPAAKKTKVTAPNINVGTTNGVGFNGPLTGLAAIGDFFARLGDPNTWIRIAKVIVGGVLLITGLAHMTGADNAVAAAARTVPLPV